jgi:ABC-type branched-subunit amino acid transport system substrate-binding protein
MNHGKLALAAAAAFAFALSAHAAAPGVTDKEILIGQDVDLTGAIAVRMKPLNQAADAYFEKVNAAGGVHGRKIRILRLDSANKPDKTKENLKVFEKEGVFAMWAVSGTGNTAAALPTLTEKGIPLIASTSGADAFFLKKNPMLFNLKAGYGDEIRRMMVHLKDSYTTRVGIVYVDTGFGKDALKTAQESIKANNLELAGVAGHKEDKSDIDAAVKKVADTKPAAVLALTLSGPAPDVIAAYTKTGQKTQLFALSIVAADALYKSIGDKSRGVIVTQVVPYPQDRTNQVVREYQDLVIPKGVKDFSHAGVEGYIYAKTLVEGLQAGGKNLTRESLVAGMEKMQRDFGGMKMAFSPASHNGSDFVEITMIGREGKLVR